MRKVAAYGMKPPRYGIPFAIASIACSRTPIRRLRPDSVAEKIAGVLDIGEVGLGEVRRAAEELGYRRREMRDGLLARLAGRELLAGGIGPQRGVPPRSEIRKPAPQLGRELQMRRGMAIESRVPFGDVLCSSLDRATE